MELFFSIEINHSDKVCKPTSLPKARPIEDFWSILKGRVYENNLRVKWLQELLDRIVLSLKNIRKAQYRCLLEVLIKYWI